MFFRSWGGHVSPIPPGICTHVFVIKLNRFFTDGRIFVIILMMEIQLILNAFVVICNKTLYPPITTLVIC